MDYTDKYKQVPITTEIYSDFLGSFIPHPHTKQITRRTNIEAIKTSLRNIILTNKYERPRKPRFGGNIRNYLFEPFNVIIEDGLKNEIERLIKNYEPRAAVKKIEVINYEDLNSLEINIYFITSMSVSTEKINLSLYRVR